MSLIRSWVGVTLSGFFESMTTLKVKDVSRWRIGSVWLTSEGWLWMITRGQKLFQAGYVEVLRRMFQTTEAGAEIPRLADVGRMTFSRGTICVVRPLDGGQDCEVMMDRGQCE